MTTIPRVIIYAKPDEMILAARMAKKLSEPGYEWPKDGVTIFVYGGEPDKPWTGEGFSARRNKNGFTIYSQQINK